MDFTSFLAGPIKSATLSVFETLHKPPKSTSSEYFTSSGMRVEPKKGVSGISMDSINISELHEALKSVLGDTGPELLELEAELELEKKRLREPSSAGQCRSCLRKIELLEEEITLLSENKKLSQYISEASLFLSENSDVTDAEEKVFGEEAEGGEVENETRRALTSKFLSIARGFIPVDLDIGEKRDLKCTECRTTLSEDDLSRAGEEGVLFCSACGAGSTYVSMDVGLRGSIGSPDAGDTIVDGVLDKAQGIGRLINYKKLKEALDEHFQGAVIGSQSSAGGRDHPSPKDIDADHELLERAIRKIAGAEKKHYLASLNSIGKCYLGWSLPDLSFVRESLLSEFRDFSDAYPMRCEGRPKPLDPAWVVWKILADRHDLDLPQCFFKKLKTTEAVNEYERIYNRCSRDLGWVE